MSTTPLRALHVDRADLGGPEHTEPAALDHRRAAHPDVRVLGGDHDVAASEDRGVAGEAVAGVDADERDRARQLGEPPERQAVEPAHADAIGVTGPTTATFGEEHDRHPQLLGDLEQPVLLAVVLGALGARQHRVVVGHRDHLRGPFAGLGAEQLAVDVADSTDQPVGRGGRDQIVELAPSPLGSDHQRAVLDERPLVDQVADVLAGRSATLRSPSLDGIRALLVETDTVTIDHLAQIVAFEADGTDADRRLATVGPDGNGDPFGDRGEFLADHDRRPLLDGNRVDRSVDRGHDLVVHLHRLDQRQHVAGPHR